jgi:hypothetical protein
MVDDSLSVVQCGGAWPVDGVYPVLPIETLPTFLWVVNAFTKVVRALAGSALRLG